MHPAINDLLKTALAPLAAMSRPAARRVKGVYSAVAPAGVRSGFPLIIFGSAGNARDEYTFGVRGGRAFYRYHDVAIKAVDSAKDDGGAEALAQEIDEIMNPLGAPAAWAARWSGRMSLCSCVRARPMDPYETDASGRPVTLAAPGSATFHFYRGGVYALILEGEG